ncbi:MAG: CcrColossus [Caulobacteraceae bacterium]|nr:CcrColossus [Caulobacteraceae bacterium]
MTEEQIKHMRDRFLFWKLPANFAPDCGIRFDADAAKKLNPTNHRYESVGTNLFDATQADGMVRFMVEDLPASARPLLEYGWALERGDSEPSRPLYWTGTALGTDPSAWTFDSLVAMRFARQVDADVAAHNLMGRGDGRMQVRVKEHGWG